MRRRELMLLLGGAMTVARGLRAQQTVMPVIGFLNGTSPGPAAPFVAAFHQGLSEAGYVEGQGVAIDYRRGLGSRDSLLVDIAALYWHFVDGVWVVVFTVVYIVGR